ncbi:MAG: hypothetical protein WAN30_07030 [Acidimicrobiales bacterium]
MRARLLLAISSFAYGWWITGVTPFTPRSYVLVAVPIAIILLCHLVTGFRPRQPAGALQPARVARTNTDHRLSAWWILLLLVVLLESLGLALGGRDSDVPTLSTVLDYVLKTHVARSLAFCLWVLLGANPVLSDRRRVLDQGA